MNRIRRGSLGTKKNPCEDNIDITIAMVGRSDCMVYMTKPFRISEDNLMEANARNIKFISKGE